MQFYTKLLLNLFWASFLFSIVGENVPWNGWLCGTMHCARRTWVFSIVLDSKRNCTKPNRPLSKITIITISGGGGSSSDGHANCITGNCFFMVDRSYWLRAMPSMAATKCAFCNRQLAFDGFIDRHILHMMRSTKRFIIKTEAAQMAFIPTSDSPKERLRCR